MSSSSAPSGPSHGYGRLDSLDRKADQALAVLRLVDKEKASQLESLCLHWYGTHRRTLDTHKHNLFRACQTCQLTHTVYNSRIVDPRKRFELSAPKNPNAWIFKAAQREIQKRLVCLMIVKICCSMN